MMDDVNAVMTIADVCRFTVYVSRHLASKSGRFRRASYHGWSGGEVKCV